MLSSASPGITADQVVCPLILDEVNGIIQKDLVQQAASDPNTMRVM